MKRSKLLVALSVLGALLIVAGGSFAAASFLFHRDQGASVEIRGGEFALFYDISLTEPVLDTDTLTGFDTLRQNVPSSVVQLYGANVGSDPLYIQCSEASLDSLLALKDGANTVGTTPFLYYTPGALVTPVDCVNPLASAVDATSTTLTFTAACGVTPQEFCRLGSEIIGIPTWPASGNTLTGVQRGLAGTVATAHPAGTAWFVAHAVTAPTGALAAGATLPFAFQLSSNGDVSDLVGSTQEFTIIFDARSDY